jgi:hypothetical protein
MMDYTAFPIHTFNIPALPDVSPITDASQFVMERSGTGRVNASAILDYIRSALGFFTTPQQFGAKADGANDDLAAINAAIAAVVANGAGGTVYFPRGVYRITNTITITSPNVQLRGECAGNFVFGGKPFGGSTIRWAGSVGGTMVSVSPVVPSGQFIYAVGLRDMNIDCAYSASGGLLLGSLSNGFFENLNIIGCTGAGIYSYTAATTDLGWGARCSFRNINIICAASGSGVVIDGLIGTTAGFGQSGFIYDNVQCFHQDADAFTIVHGDDNYFINCGSSRLTPGTGTGILLNGTSTGGKRAQNNDFIGHICADTTVGTAAPIRALGGTTPSINNRIRFSQMDGPPAVIITDPATLYYETTGSYVSGCIPTVVQPGLFSQDATFGPIVAPTRLLAIGGQNHGNVLVGVSNGTAPGGGANATLVQFLVPLLPDQAAVAALPTMNAANQGCMMFASNGRKPGEGVGAGTGVPVFWSNGVGWISVCSGALVTA